MARYILFILFLLNSCHRQSRYRPIREPEEYKNSSRIEWDFLLINPWKEHSINTGLSDQEMQRLDAYKINQYVMESNELERSLRTRIQTGNLPELFTLYPSSLVTGLVNGGLLADLSTLKPDYSVLAKHDPLWELVSLKNVPYGVPRSVVLEGLFYDKDLIPTDNFPASKDDLYQLIDELGALQIVPFYINNRDNLSFLYQLLLISMSEDDLYKKTDNLEGIQLYKSALKEMKALYDAGAFDKDAIDALVMTRSIEIPIVQGKYAMIPDGTWNYHFISNLIGLEDWGFQAFPAFIENGKSVMIHALGADTVFVSRKGKTKEETEAIIIAAKAYINWTDWYRNTYSAEEIGTEYNQIEKICSELLEDSRFQPEIKYGYPPDYYWDRIFWFQYVVDSIPAYLCGLVELNDIWSVEYESSL